MSKLHEYLMRFRKSSVASGAGACANWQQGHRQSSSEAVLSAMEDERFQFRTAASIAAETGVSEAVVTAILDSNDEIRRAPLRDEKGKSLYAWRSRRRTAREILAETHAFLAGSSR